MPSLLFRSIALLLPCLAFLAEPRADSHSRPNIVIAFADDWGRYAGAYAARNPSSPSSVVQTPHFDSVASRGALFHNAFVGSPSCTPCRSSLLSGQYFWRTGRGAILQNARWDASIPSFPLLLEESGYHIGYTYKVWTPGSPPHAPFGGRERAYQRSGGSFNRFSQTVDRAQDREAARRGLLEEVRGNFRDFLSRKPAGSPYCYWFGPTNTHRKWIRGSGLGHWGIDPADLEGKMPSFLPDVPEIREDFADYLGEIQAFDAGLGVLLEEIERTGEADRTLIVVSGDHGIPGFPRAKCNLYDFGVAVPLAVAWGEAVGPGLQIEDFVNLMDLAPTFLEAAGVQVPRAMTGRSLVPVLKAGKSGQVDPVRDHVVTGQERHVAAARNGNLPYPKRAFRTSRFLYIRNFAPDRWPMGTAPGFGLPPGPMPGPGPMESNTFAAFADFDASPTKAFLAGLIGKPGMEPYVDFAFGRRPAEELYDLETDPHQTVNLAPLPEWSQVRKRLSARLTTVLMTTGDPRVVEAEPPFERPPFTDRP